MEALCAGAVTPQCKERDLSTKDVEWILSKEGNETTYLKFVPAPGGKFPEGTWFSKEGHLLTLAEMLRFGANVCTCYDIYRTWLNLPIFVHKKYHSRSTTEHGLARNAAKQLRFEETGKYGLPKQNSRRW